MRRHPNESGNYLLLAAAFVGAWVLASMAFGRSASGGSGQLPSSAGQPLNLAGQRVLLIGSSSAVGFGSHLKTLLEQRGIAEFRNIGVGGTTLYQWSDNDKEVGRKMEETLASYQPSVVFIFVGTNDEAGGGAGTRATAIERLHRKLQGTRSIFIGLPPHQNWTMNRPFRDLLARTWGADYFNTEAVNPAKASDGYHLSTAGYRTLSAALSAWLDAKR